MDTTPISEYQPSLIGESSELTGATPPASLLLEQYAERAALSLLSAPNFTNCLIQNHIAPQITITDAHGTPLVVHGKDLARATTWRKFLGSRELPAPLLGSLVEGTETITRAYRSWLLTGYTPRYRSLAQREHLHWFRSVTHLAVTRRIMETKYHRLLAGEPHAFADAWVAQQMGTLLLLETMTTEIAKAIHHIVKAPKEEAPHLLEQLYERHATQVVERSHLAPLPLPPLPAGTSQPLLGLPAPEEEEAERSHEEEEGRDD